jgi:hypothetical protein
VAGDLEDVYDEATVAALDRSVRQPRPVPAVVAGGWRGRLGAGAIAAAAVIGVGEALDPSRNEPVIEEVDADAPPDERLPVTVFFVPGLPRATRATVRPWLF